MAAVTAGPADDGQKRQWKNDHKTTSFADTVPVRSSIRRFCIVPMAGRIASDPRHDDRTGGGDDRDPDFFRHEKPPFVELPCEIMTAVRTMVCRDHILVDHAAEFVAGRGTCRGSGQRP